MLPLLLILTIKLTTTSCQNNADDGIGCFEILRKANSCPTISSEELGITFPETLVGATTTSNEICLQENYLPVTRSCLPDMIWGPIIGQCSENITITETTQRLSDITPSAESLEEVAEITATAESIEVIDVYLISKILDIISVNNNGTLTADDLEDFVTIINDLVSIDLEILKESQNELNCTDRILNSLDTALLDLDPEDIKSITLPMISIHTITITEEIIGGIVISTDSVQNFNSIQHLPLRNQSELLETDFEIAFTISSSHRNPDFIITLFFNDNLFIEDPQEETSGSYIISVLHRDLNDTTLKLQVFFKELQRDYYEECSHWKYGYENEMPILGHWSNDTLPVSLKDQFYTCEYDHITHFGFLISPSLEENVVSDVITIFGSALSLLGIGLIFTTAFTYKSWRQNPNNKVILNVSFNLLLLISLFFISVWASAGPVCIGIGVLLHYTVLGQFCWMLIICYTNYRRLYKVTHYHIENVIVKYCLFCWGTPVVVVAVVLGLSSETYDKGPEGSALCYPKGKYQTYGLVAPLGVVLTVNLLVYGLIISQLTRKTAKLRKHTVGKSYSSYKAIIFLFFMMGFAWIFGLLAVFFENVVFSYIFCALASCHGFIMFINLVVYSKEINHLWRSQLNSIINWGKQFSGKSQTTDA